MQELDPEQVAHIARLEEGLWRMATRNDRAWMEGVLAADFEEVGASGVRHGRAETLAAVGAFTAEISDWRVGGVGDGLALARYRSRTLDDGSWRVAERVSLWRWEDRRWRLVYHQGTLVPDAGFRAAR